jgi:hypothetical protein
VPLGARNACDRTRPAAFLVSTSLLPPGPAPVKSHASALWPETQVVDWSKLVSWSPVAAGVPRQARADWVLNLLCRCVFGLGDLADRNFVLRHQDGRLVSVDEDGEPRPVYLAQELKKNRTAVAKAWAAEFRAELGRAVDAWTFDGWVDTRGTSAADLARRRLAVSRFLQFGEPDIFA